MNGQWIGEYTGTTTGLVVVNIDRREESYEGIAYISENDRALPNAACHFIAKLDKGHTDEGGEFECHSEHILAIDPNTDEVAVQVALA